MMKEEIKMRVEMRFTVLCVSLIVLGLMFAGISDAAIDAKTIVGLWLFDEGTGKVAEDASGNGNDGKLMESPKWADGKFSKSLQFDNKGTYVDCGNGKSLDVNSFTLSVWVFPTDIDVGTHEMIVGKGWAPPDGRSYYMSILQGKPFVSFRDPGDTAQADLFGTTDLKKSTWYHLAGTHDRSSKTVSIYLNGKKEGEKKFDHDVMVTTKSVWIGNLGDHQLFFGGKLDEVAIFNVALDEADINTVMTKGFKTVLTVSSKGKLTTAWGDIKSR
jgi:hypothetical protein